MIKKISVGIVAMLTVFLFGCTNKPADSVSEISTVTETSKTTEPTEPESTEHTTEAPEIVWNGINPLTGESGFNDNAVGKRPVAVMVNNIVASLPQYGIGNADIIYELPVESGITRLMAVYADYTNIGDVCSVRSCRYYYPIISLGMDAIYCHWGTDQTIALETLNRTGIDHLDGGNEESVFFRDEEREKKYNKEHTGYMKGSALPELIQRKGFRTDINEQNSKGAFVFAETERIPSEMTANKVVVNFSRSYFSTFEYDQNTCEYLKFHSGNPHIDEKTNEQLAFDNVFVLQTNIAALEDGYLMGVGLEGGTGYYFSKGGAEHISWSKNGEDQPIKVFSADGTELNVNIGESYIGFIGYEKNISIE